jgi:hypothetical protein
MDDTPNGLLLFGIAFVLASLFVLTLWAVNVLPGKVRALLTPRDMSSANDAPAAPAADMEPVYIPVSRYGMEPGGMDAPPSAAPDIDAQNTGMPRVSRDITSNELIVLLAVMRGPDRKPRFSANAIHTLVGGDRNTVMAKVKEIRNGPDAPVFPPRTPEQQQVRAELQLDGR